MEVIHVLQNNSRNAFHICRAKILKKEVRIHKIFSNSIFNMVNVVSMNINFYISVISPTDTVQNLYRRTCAWHFVIFHFSRNKTVVIFISLYLLVTQKDINWLHASSGGGMVMKRNPFIEIHFSCCFLFSITQCHFNSFNSFCLNTFHV